MDGTFGYLKPVSIALSQKIEYHENREKIEGGIVLIIYEGCKNANAEDIFYAFQRGFCDYIIKMELTQEVFIERFFGPEGNQLENSFIAFDDDRPVGVILGGIKVYEEIRTMRCGTLGVDPDYRGSGVSKELFELHRQSALNNGCKQLFLEVIAENERAIKFYKGLGYERVYDLSYYSYEVKAQENKAKAPIEVQEISLEAIKVLSEGLGDIHINWQNDFDYMEKKTGIKHFGCYKEGLLVAALSLHSAGSLHFIWTKPSERHQGIARALINRGAEALQLKTLHISFPNNANLSGFARHLGFAKKEIVQYEMYLTL
ncbi:GNAT family N-acetyltransferase [Alkaliphilus crotonatoxidans]